jgi:hypothetical protein
MSVFFVKIMLNAQTAQIRIMLIAEKKDVLGRIESLGKLNYIRKKRRVAVMDQNNGNVHMGATATLGRLNVRAFNGNP